MEGYHIGVDIGGTFTDIILLDPSGRFVATNYFQRLMTIPEQWLKES